MIERNLAGGEFGGRPKTRTEQEIAQRVEDMYGGIESFDRTATSLGIDLNSQLRNSPNPELTKKRYANAVFLSVAQRKSPKEILPKFDSYRKLYAEHMWGVKDADDATFYTLASQHFEKERSGRQLVHDMGVSMIEKAITGGEFSSSWIDAYKEYHTKAGWNPKFENEGVYETQMRQQWNEVVEKAQTFAPMIDRVETAMAQSGGFSVEMDGIAEELKGLSAEDAAFVVDVAAARQKKTAKVTDGAKTLGKSSLMGLMGASVGVAREMERIVTAAGDEVVGTAKWSFYPWLGSPWVDEDSHKNGIKRRLQRHMTGELDPLKADSWFGQRMMNSAQMLPYMLAVSNPFSMPVAALAIKNDTRTQLIDEGVPEMQAEMISLTATPLLLGIEQWQSKAALFGKGLGFKRLQKSTIKAVAGRYAARFGAIQAGEMATEFTQQMIPSLEQELWAKFDETVPDPKIQEMARQFWKMSPELFVEMMPFAAWGSGIGTAKDGRLAVAGVKYGKRLEMMGIPKADIERVIEASDESPLAFYSAFKAAFKKANVTLPEAVEAQETYVAEVQAGKVPEGYDAVLAPNGHITVTDKETGSVISDSVTAMEAEQAIRDNEFRKLAGEQQAVAVEVDPADVKSLGDVEHETLPDRPASSPREDLEAHKALKARLAAVPAAERADAVMDSQNELLSLQNRHFKGHNPSVDLLPSKPQKTSTSSFWNDAYDQAGAKGLDVTLTNAKTGKTRSVRFEGAKAVKALKTQNQVVNNLNALLKCLGK